MPWHGGARYSLKKKNKPQVNITNQKKDGS